MKTGQLDGGQPDPRGRCMNKDVLARLEVTAEEEGLKGCPKI
jgi:hypothetical protein